MGKTMRKLIGLLLAVVITVGSAAVIPGKDAEAASGPRKTSLLALEATTTGFRAYWKMQTSGTDGYQLWYKRRGAQESATKMVAGNTSVYKAVSGLCPGQLYRVRIRTYQKVGKEKIFSAWSKRKSVTVLWSRWQRNARTMYRYMHRKGLDDLHIAAVMGCLYPESGFDPTSVETIFTEPFMIGERKAAAEEVGFRMKKINKKYAELYPAIMRAGIGIMGWTDVKGIAAGQGGNTQLRKYASDRGKNWHSLGVQLGFWWNGRENVEGYKNWHGRSRFEKAKTLNKATHVYLCWALAGWKCRDPKNDDWHETIGLPYRKAMARKFYRYIINGSYD